MTFLFEVSDRIAINFPEEKFRYSKFCYKNIILIFEAFWYIFRRVSKEYNY